MTIEMRDGIIIEIPGNLQNNAQERSLNFPANSSVEYQGTFDGFAIGCEGFVDANAAQIRPLLRFENIGPDVATIFCDDNLITEFPTDVECTKLYIQLLGQVDLTITNLGEAAFSFNCDTGM